MLSQVIAAGAASFMLAAPAHTPSFSLTASPSHLLASPGQTVQVRATDTGTRPLAVTASVMTVRKAAGHCTVSPAPVRGVTLDKTSFRLRHGQTVTVRARVSRRAPPQDLAVIFAADAGQASQRVHVTGEVGTRLYIRGSGHASRCSTAAAAVRHPAGSSSGVAGLGNGLALGSLAAAMMAGTVVVVRRRFRRLALAQHRRVRLPGNRRRSS